MTLPISLRLALRQWLARPLRPILCSLAIAASVALIVCVGAAMDSLRETISHAIGQALGVAEIHIRPVQRDTDARLDQAMLDRVRTLPEVDFADGRLLSQAVLTKGDDRLWFDVVGVDEPLDDKLRPQVFVSGHGITPGPDEASELVVDSYVAQKLNLKVGEQVRYSINDVPEKKLTIVGIVQSPSIELIARPTMFVPLKVLAKDMGIAPAYNVIDLKLKDSAGIEDYDQYAKALNLQLGKSVEVVPGTTSKAKLGDLTRTLRLFLLVLSTLSAFSASLIIGTTLSVGIQERVRQFGQLRCIGAKRGQLAAFLLGDAAVLLIAGELFGVLLGIGLSVLLVRFLPQFFEEYQLSAVSVSIALFSGAFATLLGALIPIWQVMRVSPMAAVTASAKPSRASRIYWAAAGGVLCMILQIILWNLPFSRDFRVFSYILAGVPLIFAGWCLLAPAIISACEWIGALVLGTLFNVQSTLLRTAWSRTPWRAGAMIAALMIGVTLFTTVRARGQSIRQSWVGPKIPDLIIKTLLGNLSDHRIARLKTEHPELKDITPFDYFTVKMKTSPSPVGKILHDDETTFVAIDPNQFASMVDLDYVQGNPKEALQQLADGGHVYVTTEFHNVRGLGVGDKLTLRRADGKETDFTIAAVVDSTGLEVVKNYFDLRAAFGEKAVSSLLGNIADARRDFKMGDPTLAVMNVSQKMPDGKPVDLAELRKDLSTEGIQSLSSVDLKGTLDRVISRIMNGLSVIGLGALCVASLGVANMVIASVHARRFEFGVLRAIGAGRFQLVRMVLAEVTLVAIIAGILGAGAGLSLAFMATRMDWLLLGFPTHFIDPKLAGASLYAAILVAVAIGITAVLAWLAALFPAMRGAFLAQRELLAGGRG